MTVTPDGPHATESYPEQDELRNSLRLSLAKVGSKLRELDRERDRLAARRRRFIQDAVEEGMSDKEIALALGITEAAAALYRTGGLV